ncbi:transducin family protein/WD-40 repeat family protein [Capsaspora owczarzaki ATCC 30864]|uniref:Transducin family protein/WD-40 repeat family protein n=1 Tax=Capsaspora owczarzaki (strain ATCC 30864) TaxID=595528 RepID=A0A0D2WLF0_CAPO3|nr:transducin family protein/WD-40 repeat family protein [Capsaspora owczarzaki ATCC 30864]KJE91395.1 transducin family protein/WD-40 repeat family protein [Capsaspora owczarzaki ATCC 30864]|eukprot:XP_004349281.2 transducin family protein/WD-40 repeat family protein [Capsaspora owczarzaki ATCC 30864]
MVHPKTAVFSAAKTREIRDHTNKITAVGWNTEGRYLGTASLDKSLRIWHFSRQDLELKGHTEGIDKLCWSPTSASTISTCSHDRTVRIWDVRAGKVANVIQTEGGANIGLAWSPDGQTIAVGNRDDIISFIDVRQAKVLKRLDPEVEANEMAWNAEGDIFYISTGLGAVQMYQFPSMTRINTVQAHTGNCVCIRFDPKGRFFATGSADSLVSIWDAYELICLRTVQQFDLPIRAIGFSHDSQFIASASEDKFIDISAVDNAESVYQIPVASLVNTLAWHPKEHILAYGGETKDAVPMLTPSGSGSADGTVRIFGLA